MILLLALALVGEAPVEQNIDPKPNDILLELIGSCYQTHFTETTTDTHCFTKTDSEKLVIDIHKVRGANNEIIYEGVSTYRLNPQKQIQFDYYNSDGDLIKGIVTRQRKKIAIEMEEIKAKAEWEILVDSYVVRSKQFSKPQIYVKIGEANKDGL